jgi:ATP-dependent DNA helicase RecG
VLWLTGSPRWQAQAAAAAAGGNDGAQLVVGTHALIQESIDFSRLGLIIVDEQHRFGVRQRLELRRKGGNPHQLMMSATPIPRTLAMSYYADLDVSLIDEMPAGRSPVRTRLFSADRREAGRCRGARCGRRWSPGLLGLSR